MAPTMLIPVEYLAAIRERICSVSSPVTRRAEMVHASALQTPTPAVELQMMRAHLLRYTVMSASSLARLIGRRWGGMLSSSMSLSTDELRESPRTAVRRPHIESRVS